MKNALLKKIFSRPVAVMVAAYILMCHAILSCVQVVTIKPEEYRDHAAELKVTPRWRYGYVRGYHATQLVKTRNVPEMTNPEAFAGDEEFAATLREKLDARPRRCADELAFYLIFVGYMFWGGPWLRRRWLLGSGWLTKHMCVSAAQWILGWTLFAFPFLALGYGPRADAFSPFGPGFLNGGSGQTCSYELLIEIASLLPMVAEDTAGITPPGSEDQTADVDSGVVNLVHLNRQAAAFPLRSEIWLAGAMFYGVIGLFAGICRSIIDLPSRSLS